MLDRMNWMEDSRDNKTLGTIHEVYFKANKQHFMRSVGPKDRSMASYT